MLPPVMFYDARATAAACDAENQASAEADTLIFVDIDGVLNIGIRDPEGAPLQFSADNAERALTRLDQINSMQSSHRIAVERIAATYSREVGHDEDAPYAKLLSDSGTSLSDMLVGRLARLIEAAGPRCRVVLSSTWRMPRHLRRARLVEAALSRHLGRFFVFDARTQIRDDRTPALRLQCIADYATEYCSKSLAKAKQLRVLVLEDFHITPMGTWSYNKQKMNSAGAVEQSLRSCLPACVKASVRLIHTYDEWTTEGGLNVQLGCGLTRLHFNRALAFLEATCKSSTGDEHPSTEPQMPALTGAVTNAAARKGSDWLKMPDTLANAFLRTVPCVG